MCSCIAHLSDGLPVETYQAGSVNVKLENQFAVRRCQIAETYLDLMSGVRKRIVHVAFKRDIEAD